MLIHSAFPFKSVISALLIIALVSPSAAIAIEGAGGGPGGGSNAAGDTGGYDAPGTDSSFGGGKDSDSDGKSDGKEAAEAAADSKDVADAAAAQGVTGLSVEPVDTTKDSKNALEGAVSVNGQTMSKADAMAAIGAMAAANAAGMAPATGPTAPGYNVDATLSSYANDNPQANSVVGNMTGVTGVPDAVAHAEIDAAIGYDTATNNSVNDAVGLGIADSFGFTGPNSTSVTDAPTAMGMLSDTATLGFPSLAQDSLPGTASPFGFDLSTVEPTTVSTQSVPDDTPTSPYSSFQNDAPPSPASYSGFMSADSFDDSPMAQSFDNNHTAVAAVPDVVSVPGIPTNVTMSIAPHTYKTDDLAKYQAYWAARQEIDDAYFAFDDPDTYDENDEAYDAQISSLAKSMFNADTPNISYSPADTAPTATTDTNNDAPTATTDTENDNNNQTAEPTSMVDKAIEAVNAGITAVTNGFNNAVAAVANALGISTNQAQNTQTAQNNQQTVNVDVISMTQAEMDAMFGPTAQQATQNNQTAPATPQVDNTNTAQNTQTTQTSQTAPTAPTNNTTAPTQSTNQNPSMTSPTPMGPSQTFSPQNNQQVDTTSYTDQSGNQQTAQSRPETEADRSGGGQPGYAQTVYEGPESRDRAADVVAAIAVFENPVNPASVAENVKARAQNENQFPDTVTGVVSANATRNGRTTYAYEPMARFAGNVDAMIEAAKQNPAWADARAAADAVLTGATTPQTVVVSEDGKVAQVATHFVNPAVVNQRGASASTQSWVNSVVNNPASVTVQGPGSSSHVHGIPAGESGGQNLSPQLAANEVGTTPVAPSAGFEAGTLGASPATPGTAPQATPVETVSAPPASNQAPTDTTPVNAQQVAAITLEMAMNGPTVTAATAAISVAAQALDNLASAPAPSAPTGSAQPGTITKDSTDDEVQAFWAQRQPDGAKADIDDVNPHLLKAEAMGIQAFEAKNPGLQVSIQGPASGFRSHGSTSNHGEQADGYGAALDVVINDTTTNSRYTNHPASKYRGSVSLAKAAPVYQQLFNDTVTAAYHVDPKLAQSLRFGGYFSSSNPMDTMHTDTRGHAGTAGGNTLSGFTPAQMSKYGIAQNNPLGSWSNVAKAAKSQYGTPSGIAAAPAVTAAAGGNAPAAQAPATQTSAPTPAQSKPDTTPSSGAPSIGEPQTGTPGADDATDGKGETESDADNETTTGDDGETESDADNETTTGDDGETESDADNETTTGGGGSGLGNTTSDGDDTQTSSGGGGSVGQPGLLDQMLAALKQALRDIIAFFGKTSTDKTRGSVATTTPATSTPATASSTSLQLDTNAQVALVIGSYGSLLGSIWSWATGKETRETYTNLPVIDRDAEVVRPYLSILIRIDEADHSVRLAQLPMEDEFYEDVQMPQPQGNKLSLALNPDGSILYSDGTYAPIYQNGIMIDSGIDYQYFIERYNNGQLLASEINTDNLPGNLFTRAVDSVFSKTSPFSLGDIATVTYVRVDPDINMLDDEYKAYEITLTDGSVRRVNVPVTTSLALYTETFSKIGYQGDVMELTGLGVETARRVTEYGPNLIERLTADVSGLLTWSSQDPGDTFADLSTLNSQMLARSEQNQLATSDIAVVNIYLQADLKCPENYGENDSYVYEVSTSYGQIYGGMCGSGMSRHYAEAVANDLNRVKYFKDLVRGESILPTMRFYFKATSDIPAPASTEIEPTIPNRTNNVSFEIKAINDNGQTTLNWSKAESVVISPGSQIYFRWDGSDYEQCLPFLNDNGRYALTVRDQSMRTGNTETDNFDVPESIGIYRVECGGQQNGEFGVDERKIGVVIE